MDSELQRLNNHAAVLQTARVAYSNALNDALVDKQNEPLADKKTNKKMN